MNYLPVHSRRKPLRLSPPVFVRPVLKAMLGLTFLFTLLMPFTASATKWVRLQYEDASYWIDADTAVRKGHTLIFWLLMDGVDPGTLWHGVMTAKQEFKFEVDLRPPERVKSTMVVWFDFNGRRIDDPNPDPRPWGPLHPNERPIVEMALSLAKEGSDSEIIPSFVPDH